MGFLREYGILIAIALTVATLGYVWHLRGNYDDGKTVVDTQKTVAPIEQHEQEIARHPLNGPALLNSLQHYKY